MAIRRAVRSLLTSCSIMPVVESPTELKQLPLLALLAFAARCARRVSPLFRLDPQHPDATECQQAIETAIRLTEELAAGIDVDFVELGDAEEGAVRAVVVASELLPADERAAFAANAAYAAVSAAKAVLEASTGDNIDEEAERVAEAASIARDSAVSADERVERAAHLDWEMLHRMFLGRFPDFGEAVEASETGMLGPLFPDRHPAAQETKRSPDEAAPGDKTRTASGGKGKTRKDSDQQRLLQERAQLDQTAAQVQREVETVRQQQLQLRCDAEHVAADRARLLAEVDSLRDQVEAERRQLQADRAHFEADRQAARQHLDAELVELERLEELHRQQVERIEADRRQFAGESEKLEIERRQFETKRQGIQADLAKIEAASAKVRQETERCELDRQNLTAETGKIEAARRLVETDRKRLTQETATLQTALRQLAEKQAHVRDEATALQAATKKLEADSALRTNDLDAREAKLAEQIAALDELQKEHEKSQAEARLQLEQEKQRVRLAFESLQNERREFLEERLRWKPPAG